MQTKAIENWEAQDEPEHLRTIRDRLLKDDQQAVLFLQRYQQILQQDKAAANSPEHKELLLSGLVVKQKDSHTLDSTPILKVANPIYRAVFNPRWVKQQLNSLHQSALDNTRLC